MFQKQRAALSQITNLLTGIFFIVLALTLIPKQDVSFVFAASVALVLMVLVLCIFRYIDKALAAKLRNEALYTKETALISGFITKIRSAYSLEDLISAIRSELEDKADASVLIIDRKKNYVVYNSPDRIVSAKETLDTLERNFSVSMADGWYLLGTDLGVVSDQNKSRGFFVIHNGVHFYVFCRCTRLLDELIFPQVLDEFISYTKRSDTIAELSGISELTKEWNMVADTQRSFLPQKMPEIKHLDLAAYFRPLVNVSGDYYSVLPIDEDKTLLLLGDVSGKGLAAALVMGIVINTVKNIQNKEDLPAMIRAVDRAIKSMKFDDKYTVMFLGIVDTAAMTISYINASMSDPIVITKTPGGFNIKPLGSNCSLVGIIEIDDLEIEVQKLFYDDMILIATDGVSEVMNDEGIELGDTELFKQTIQNSAYKSAQHFVNDISDLVLEYNGDKKLRDDVTMLAVKIER